MEFLLAVACFFLWRVSRWAKECALQLQVLNGTANEQRRSMTEGLERVENQIFDLNEKMTSIEEAADAYYGVFIKPMRGY